MTSINFPEPITLRVMLQNPLHISLPLHDVRLLWTFKKASDPSSHLIDNELMPESSDTPVHTQHLDSIVLKPDCTQEVSKHCYHKNTCITLNKNTTQSCLQHTIPGYSHIISIQVFDKF